MIKEKTFKPLRIVYHMASPVNFSGSAIHLDSLLAYVVIHVAGYYKSVTPVGWEPSNNDICSLPLDKMRWGSLWWYRASSFYPEGAISRQNWAKRFDVENIDVLNLGKARKLTATSGAYKDYFAPVEAIYVPEIEFYAMGDFRRVKDLARRVKNIGKKGSMGYGVVRSMDIDAIDCPRSQFDRDWKLPTGNPARNLPVGFCVNKGLVVHGSKIAPITPPYWRISETNVTEVAI